MRQFRGDVPMDRMMLHGFAFGYFVVFGLFF